MKSSIRIVCFICCIFQFSCSTEPTNTSSGDLISTQIDIQSGFEGHTVKIQYNNKVIFKSKLSDSSPLAGPLALFKIKFPKGNNLVYIFWSTDGLSKSDSIEFILGNKNNYFIGIQTSDDNILFQIQDSEFLYL